jgi:hypothetical protein
MKKLLMVSVTAPTALRRRVRRYPRCPAHASGAVDSAIIAGADYPNSMAVFTIAPAGLAMAAMLADWQYSNKPFGAEHPPCERS